ncbi:LysE family translocator [Marinobacterium arenosum]|uniref:LysE family translocator n=1 Tax=Marinobacterium arenosum TaxID=2862496 RepID=UPI001C95D94A|nr:LysE family translocator [Marinobacterium arenosum]MBY4676197.1 LysE family translocator [Marinobacterium arenosum]
MEFLLPLASYAFVTSITPGPNNLMLTASGIRFGFRRSIPHILGINAGMALLLTLCGVGVGALIQSLPAAALALKLFGTGYLLYLAWLLRANLVAGGDGEHARPMGFFNALLFQFANPKAWVMALTSASVLMPALDSQWLSLAVFCLVFCSINLPCISCWALAGSGVKRFLADPFWQRLFSGIIVLLTLYAAAAIWF